MARKTGNRQARLSFRKNPGSRPGRDSTASGTGVCELRYPLSAFRRSLSVLRVYHSVAKTCWGCRVGVGVGVGYSPPRRGTLLRGAGGFACKSLPFGAQAVEVTLAPSRGVSPPLARPNLGKRHAFPGGGRVPGKVPCILIPPYPSLKYRTNRRNQRPARGENRTTGVGTARPDATLSDRRPGYRFPPPRSLPFPALDATR